MQCVENCSDPNPANRVLYEQPVWQTLQMFLGEMLFHLPSDSEGEPLVPNKAEAQSEHLSGSKVLLLWIPALCDLTGTTLMNVGLLYTPVSIYQMTRGALVLFVGILSVIFLHRRLWLYQWVSLITVMTGVCLVGLSGFFKGHEGEDALIDTLLPASLAHVRRAYLSPEAEASKVLVGVFFILFAQIFTATHLWIIYPTGRYSVAPLVAVGYEGLFGAITILLFFPILAIPSVAAKSTFFDLPRGWHQMVDTPTVLYSGIAIACSIALFNFFGLSVTRHVSATARSLTDTCRTLSIWLISLGLGWERFIWPISMLQVLGFSLLVYFLFNNLVSPRPSSADDARTDAEEEQGLLSSTLDETAALPTDLGQSGFDVVPEGRHALAQGKVVSPRSE
ncbi:hypothetical protein PLEOSDRAFT_1073782 [Pleurotus ostreatus PC15]|uniref:EamA domain-containing protein n=1 Tax=Pleurotus ostreatus (strain PC15) TaxID=1137138 RepID=A0A067NZR9_PLEO1|nr:hypothetical protein PLEOSDRAFT_1073782 [Pleurotus ostreatus PC15]